MLNKIANLYKICFPNDNSFGPDQIAAFQKDGGQIIFSDNSFVAWRAVLDEAELYHIAVHPDFRRGGIANSLLVCMENELKKQSVKKIFLEVRVSNKPAIELYKKNGYEQISVRKNYYYDNGEDAFVMSKII
ncbi:MAG: ribosomal protein S18-alanine N-acetyltransferase [Rickettsiales bacterium]|jgi:ribosomal-protein-alanine acetyltransferase|nr:ribosomal protein S18-alanine N-acetyltransferase [Rickettsiales bacterium]